jgi:quinoprotein glucose dehydrogenase
VKNHPLLRGVTLPKTGSTGRAALLLVTKTLVFAGEGYNGQPFFRALDKKTGATLWEAQTPVGPPTGVPMTYMHQGKQYVVVAIEGNNATRTASQLVAYALP